MKKSILAMAAFTCIAGAILTSCNTSAERVENAQENVIQANKDLDQANQEYLADIENYRLETASRIEANEQAIADFNAGLEHEKKAVRAEHKKKIAELEQKNREMKKKLEEYKAEGKENWEIFKAEFSHDMDELGKAFKNVTVKNVQ
jgi:chromosome segregation ATPase